MTLNSKRAIGCFLAAYFIVTVMATATTMIYAAVNDSPPPPAGASALKAPAFVETVPYHVLIMLLVWPVFAWVYFRRKGQNPAMELKETVRLSIFWLIAAIITDLIGFVLIPHPYSFTFYEFYVIYQPWISLIYVAIFLSPFIRLGLSRMYRQK